MRRLIALTVALMMGIVVAACGLPTDDKFTRIDEADDGFRLSQTTTTSTTLAPTTTIDATTSTTIAVTSTSIATEQVDIYFPTGRELTSIQVALPLDPSLTQVMALILVGPPEGELGRGLRAILPPDAAVTATEVNGVATVDFPEGIFDDMAPRDQRLVFGQIVLTLSRLRGIGPVLFTQAEQPISVYLGSGSSTNPGDFVSKDDYTMLVGGAGQEIETTTTTTTTTVPLVDPATTTTAEA